MKSRADIESVPCPRCGAAAGTSCDFRESHPTGGKHKPYHVARAKAAEQTRSTGMEPEKK